VSGRHLMSAIVLATHLSCASTSIFTAQSPSDVESYCAWLGDVGDGVLYFGESAFWSAAWRHGNDPLADLLEPGPRRIGRFDLVAERMLPPLDIPGDSRSGIWDVLFHPNGRLYFTNFYEFAGWVDPRTAEVQLLPHLGDGLNELTLGPDRSILATRYGYSNSRPSSVVKFDPDGRLLAEYLLDPSPGYDPAAKSVAYDRVRDWIWINTDLFARDGRPIQFDARVLDGSGRELARWETPMLHFMTFGLDGTGYLAEVSEDALFLRIVPPDATGPPPTLGRSIRLDASFTPNPDFVQDVRVDGGGRVVLTAWSGRIYVVGPGDRVRTLQLPRPGGGGLYYAGVLTDDRVCAILCSQVTVVCAPAP